MTEKEWKEGIAAWNKIAIGRVGRFRTSELRAECLRKPLAENTSGRLTNPDPRTDTVAVTTNLTPRYAIFEKHGKGARKVSIIDDVKASGVNALTTTRDTAVPDSLDALFALTSYYRLIKPACDLRAASSDFRHEYKNVGIPRDEGKFPSVLLGPPAGPLVVSQMRTQPFGSTRAPAYCGRVARLIQWMLFAYFGIYLPICVGDCFLVEPADTVTSAFECANALISMCGFAMGRIPHRLILSSYSVRKCNSA